MPFCEVQVCFVPDERGFYFITEELMTSLFRWFGSALVAVAFTAILGAPDLPLAAQSAGGLYSPPVEGPSREAAPPPMARPNTSVQASPATLLLNQDFGLAFPPAGWIVTPANTAYSWILGLDTYGPLDGDALNAEDPAHHAQNEWLKTPTMNFVGGYSQILLTFHFKMSYDRAISPTNVQDLQVWISTNAGSTWPTKVWDETNVGVFPNYQWVGATVNLTSYIGKNTVKLAFRSVGTGGGPVDLDMVEVATFLCGDLTNDQVLNSGDVVTLVNYIFKGSLPPNPPSAADMNNDGKVNSSDIVFLVNHVFKGAPAPPCP
jgi:hypothetical protein